MTEKKTPRRAQDHTYATEVGSRIEQVRRRDFNSQKALAAEMGCNPALVCHWEHGHSLPSLERFRDLCQATGIPADWYLGLSE